MADGQGQAAWVFEGCSLSTIARTAGHPWARLKNGSIDVQKHVDAFRAEMCDVGAHEHSLFILLGNHVEQLFKEHLAGIYPNHVSCAHYSNYGKGFSDAESVEKTWNTLEFARNDMMRRQLQELKDKQKSASQ
jgi:hypothetical protein